MDAIDELIEGIEGVEVERVERETVLEADEERAWEAISDPSELERWLADAVELEPVEGTPARFEVDGEERAGRVERVVEGRELAFTWCREPGEESLVELELTPCVGGTRISVVETRLRTAAGASPLLMSAWDDGLRRLRSLARMVLA
ncbi:MAG: SRPBCC domain-containing protein [Solirubrobacterales bacterium]